MLSGGAGNALILGGKRDADELPGGAGNDGLDGADGFDVFDGGMGADRPRSGGIADPALTDGWSDRIVDFADKLRLEGSGAGATLAYPRDQGGRPKLRLHAVSEGADRAAFIVRIAGDGSGGPSLSDDRFAF